MPLRDVNTDVIYEKRFLLLQSVLHNMLRFGTLLQPWDLHPFFLMLRWFCSLCRAVGATHSHYQHKQGFSDVRSENYILNYECG